MTTEAVLKDWRYGPAQAERLCSALLHLEGFSDVDPQHPLGGRDGRKDVLCKRGGYLWVTAVYFAATRVRFPRIKKKFMDDFEGVRRNKASGYVFFVNQSLTIGERDKLLKLSYPIDTVIFNLERMRALLDSPKGCGTRLEYLRIPMTPEEQVSFFSAMNYEVIRKLLDDEARFSGFGAKIDEVLIQNREVLSRTNALELNLEKVSSSLHRFENSGSVQAATVTLSLSTLCWIHRIATENSGLPEAMRGRFRAIEVWLGGSGTTRSEAVHVPPPPSEVIARTMQLISWWKSQYHEVKASGRSSIISALAQLHHRFLLIHPFVDGNGRVARLLIDEAARELLSQRIGPELTSDPARYYEALRTADAGDLKVLERLITAALQ
jgi:hypothetical protein